MFGPRPRSRIDVGHDLSSSQYHEAARPLSTKFTLRISPKPTLPCTFHTVYSIVGNCLLIKTQPLLDRIWCTVEGPQVAAMPAEKGRLGATKFQKDALNAQKLRESVPGTVPWET
jgi:hypothetical protein